MQLSFEGQVLAANVETRTIRGMVVPFSRVGNTSAGPVRFEFGAFGDIDPSQIILNSEHDRTRPLGRGVAESLEVTPAGISMAFKIAPTNAGNDALVEAAEGLRPPPSSVPLWARCPPARPAARGEGRTGAAEASRF